MTERLYYSDCYLREFRARVIGIADEGRRVYLDRTAFYPTSGGQPYDIGTLGGVAVVDVVDEEHRVAHLLEAPLPAEAEIEGRIDWARRYDHMQQHTGQHLLSAVFEELYQARTLSFHMGAAFSTIELGIPSLSPQQIERVERRCADLAADARPVSMTFEDASEDLGLRKASERTGTLRIVSIEGADKSACGGTHVRTAAETAPIFIRKLDKVRGNVRVEFVCGLRALKQARTDFETLTQISQALSAPIENTPALVASLAVKTKDLEKTCQRLTAELAVKEGRELYNAAEPDGQGIRRCTQRGSIDDAMRARAQSFVAGGCAAFLAVCDDPPSILLAASADSGIHAGNLVKAAVTAEGGRGGGNASVAQGSVPNAQALAKVVEKMA